MEKKRRISEGGGTGDGEGGAPVLLSELRGWGPVSIQKLYKAIDQSRQSLSCARLIYGLGIPKIGEQTAKDIAAVFGNDFIAFWTYAKAEADSFQSTNQQAEFASKISAIPGIGPVTLESLLKYSSLYLLEADSHTSPSPQTPNPLRQEVDKLIAHLSLLSRPPPSVAAVEATNPSVTPRQIFQGKRVVFSGKLSNMTRQQAWELTEQLGGQVDKQISAHTNLIVVPSLASDDERSVKLRKAKEKGIEIWTESEWQERLRPLQGKSA